MILASFACMPNRKLHRDHICFIIIISAEIMVSKFLIFVNNKKKKENLPWQNWWKQPKPTKSLQTFEVLFYRFHPKKECRPPCWDTIAIYLPTLRDIGVRFLSWECWDFRRQHDHFWRFPKKFEVFWRRLKYKRELAPSTFHRKNQRSRGTYFHLFILHMVFVLYMGLS